MIGDWAQSQIPIFISLMIINFEFNNKKIIKNNKLIMEGWKNI